MVDLPVSVAILLGTYVLCISLNSNRERERVWLAMPLTNVKT